jgi:hypothetical protein
MLLASDGFLGKLLMFGTECPSVGMQVMYEQCSCIENSREVSKFALFSSLSFTSDLVSK